MPCSTTESNIAAMRAMFQRLDAADRERAFNAVVRLYAAASSSSGAPVPPSRAGRPAVRRPARGGNVLPFRARVAGEVR